MLASQDLSNFMQRVAAVAGDLEGELNTADAALGDGDTGIMLKRLFDAIASVQPADNEDLGVTFAAFAASAMSATGSSLGTLVATGLTTMSKASRGHATLAPETIGDQLLAVRDAMIRRGGAELGDKTILDVVDAVGRRIAGISDLDDIKRSSVAAAEDALDTFRSRPCRIGRARMFADKSVGLDDPGMLAVARILAEVFRAP